MENHPTQALKNDKKTFYLLKKKKKKKRNVEISWIHSVSACQFIPISVFLLSLHAYTHIETYMISDLCYILIFMWFINHWQYRFLGLSLSPSVPIIHHSQLVLLTTSSVINDLLTLSLPSAIGEIVSLLFFYKDGFGIK